MADVSFGKVFVDVFFFGLSFGGVEGVKVGFLEFFVGFDVDGVVPRLVFRETMACAF